MADLLANILSMLMPQQQQPQVVAQDRYMRTPIVQQQQMPGAGASYNPKTDQISVGDLNSLPTGILAHEVTHRIYNKAGLSRLAPELMPNLAKATHDYIANSPLYQGVSGAGSPDQFADEGLAFSNTSPVMGDRDFVNAAALKIADQSLKGTLLRIFSNRQGAKSID
jgi:hypothetical protein